MTYKGFNITLSMASGSLYGTEITGLQAVDTVHPWVSYFDYLPSLTIFLISERDFFPFQIHPDKKYGSFT
jgi:hypothetical protein